MEPKLFKEIAAEWVSTKRRLVKRSTFCAYNLILHTHLLPLFGNHAEISEIEAQNMVLDKLGNGLARKTVRDILATLKSIIKFGVKHYGWTPIVWEIDFPSETIVKHLPVLSMANHRRLMNYIMEAPNSSNIGVMIALCTGMR